MFANDSSFVHDFQIELLLEANCQLENVEGSDEVRQWLEMLGCLRYSGFPSASHHWRQHLLRGSNQCKFTQGHARVVWTHH